MSKGYEQTSKKYDICFISPKAYLLFNSQVKATFGGAEVQLYILGKALAQRGYKVTFLVADYGQSRFEIVTNIHLFKALNFSRSKIKKIFDFIRIIFKVRSRIYVQSTLTQFSGIIALIVRILGGKYVYMVASDSETDGTADLFKSLISRVLAKSVFRISDLILTQNDFQKRNLDKLDIKNFKFDYSYKIFPFAKGKKKDSILWVARSDSWKQPQIFLKLAKEFPEEKFIMICPPSTKEPGLSVEIERLANNIKNLNFIEFVPFAKIDKFFQKAKIFINTSKPFEGFPNTFIQAAKNRTPIISLYVNPNKFIMKNKCGFVCDSDIDLMIKNLRLLLNNRTLYEKFAENIYKYAIKNHDIEKNSKEFIKLVSKIDNKIGK